jgi:hypothetical protein
MLQNGEGLEGVEWGNAWDLRDPSQPHTNWFVGDHPAIPRDCLRFLQHGDPLTGSGANSAIPSPAEPVSHLCLKWFQHHPDDDPAWGAAKPSSTGRTLSLLAAPGAFALTFHRGERQLDLVLEQAGDFVLWAEGLEHSWRVLAPSIVLTVRWTPLPLRAGV